MKKINLSTPDLAKRNIEKLSAVFPNVVKEGKVDFELLKQMLSDYLIEECRERYGLNWVGKKNSILKANIPIKKTLKPVKEKSVDFEKTKNIYIEGDNFEALKIIQESYLGKIKMIYIDPPYNTGKDFIYKDDFKQDKTEYDEESGAIDEDGVRLFKNTDSNGRFHSDWLSMMYKRLLIARDLLREDGVIFISIDDNEVHNLRHICDEVFGERNFVGSFIKQSKIGGGSDSKYIANEHEYVIVYAKNIDKLQEFYEEHSPEYLERYKEEDEKGRYFWDTFARPGLKNPINYDILAPDGTIINGDWIWSKARFEKEYKKGNIRIVKLRNSKYSVQFKQYLNKKGKKPRSMTTDFGGTFLGKKNISELFMNDKIFSYPKSVFFIKKLLKFVTNNNDIILDFFSGSATTAHAVMELNAEDGGNRQFIMVQLPEPVDEKSEAYKAGYRTIAEIGRERIIRAANKIKEDFKDKDYINSLDFGFRYFKVDTSNFREPKDIEEIKQELLFDEVDNIKPDRKELDLLFEIILNLGLELTLNIEVKEVKGKKVYFVERNSLVACFDDDIDETFAEELMKAEEKPLKIVLKDNSFKTDSDKINFEQTVKELNSDTEILVV